MTGEGLPEVLGLGGWHRGKTHRMRPVITGLAVGEDVLHLCCGKMSVQLLALIYLLED